MKKKFLVLTKKKIFYTDNVSKMFLDRFFSGYHYDFDENEDILIEENLDVNFTTQIIPRKIEYIKNLLIPILSTQLNELHKINFSKKFWARILNNWLLNISFNLCCKYYRMKYVLEQYKDDDSVEVALLAAEDMIHIDDVTDFAVVELSEKYDFQLWTKVIENFTDKSMCCQYVQYLEEKTDDRYGKFLPEGAGSFWKNFKDRICVASQFLKNKQFKRLKNFLGRLFIEQVKNANTARCYMYYPGFNSALFDEVVVSTKGNIRAMPKKITGINSNSDKPSRSKNIDCDLRKNFKENIMNLIIQEDNEIRNIINIILDELPMCFMESFSDIRNQYQKYMNHNVKYILSRHGIFINTRFLFYIAEMNERYSCELRGIQHGGNYQVDKIYWTDMQVSDKFYVWGKVDKTIYETGRYHKTDRFIESAPYKLQTYSEQNKVLKKNSSFLFVGVHLGPYLWLGDRRTLDTKKTIDDKITFLSNLDREVHQQIMVREFIHEYGWNIKDVLKKEFSELRFDDNRDINAFIDCLKQSNLCICDHLGTVWIEALVLNKPLIMFFPKDAYVFWDLEKPYFDLLEKVGILHFSPESAASLVNKICDNVDEWWNEAERKLVVETVVNHYWNHFGDPDRWWLTELKSLVK